jgi:NADPH:quinone reductase-like Zn-dependent oxidoreductase
MENWWEVPEFQENPFDLVIDCAVGREAWYKCGSVVKGKKDGGRWVAVIMQDWHIDGQHVYQVIQFLLPPLGRWLVNCVRRTSPEYRIYLDTAEKETMKKIVDMADKKEFKVIIDNRGPFPFTTKGVRDAWNLHIARGGHGKIVIEID